MGKMVGLILKEPIKESELKKEIKAPKQKEGK